MKKDRLHAENHSIDVFRSWTGIDDVVDSAGGEGISATFHAAFPATIPATVPSAIPATVPTTISATRHGGIFRSWSCLERMEPQAQT